MEEIKKKLILVGTGIKTISHLTRETQSCIEKADIVLFLVNEPILKEWIKANSKKAISLDKIYFKHSQRAVSYKEITKEIINCLDSFNNVCVAIYGHPTVFASSGLDAVYELEKKGVETLIMPGISAEDCLFSDLKMDPSSSGCYSVEATQFILMNKLFDPCSHLIIWQVGMIGNIGLPSYVVNMKALQCLLDKLLTKYPPNHSVIIYEASIYPGMKPAIMVFDLIDLCDQILSPISTLYIPPLKQYAIDELVLSKIGLTEIDLLT